MVHQGGPVCGAAWVEWGGATADGSIGGRVQSRVG